ncbi:unnamed protein product [Closterium sp. Yama58-4]|nr:unnamed protein product [Closterium sp. Yama58-4]
MRDKQRGQPAYAFLEAGGEGADYYRFRLWCALSGAGGAGGAEAAAWTEVKGAAEGQAEHAAGKQGEADGEQGSAEVKIEGEQEGEKQAAEGAPGAQQAQTGSEAPPAVPLPANSTPPLPPEPPQPPTAPPPTDPADVALAAAVAAAGLPADVGGEAVALLAALSGTKEAIKGGKAWVAWRAGMGWAPHIAWVLRERMAALAGQPERQLHVIYLVNDVLFNSLQQRPHPGAVDAVAAALQPCLGFMLAALFHRGGDAQSSNQERLGKILAFWASKEVYPGETMAHLGALMRLPPHQHPPMPPPPPVPAMDYHAAGEWIGALVLRVGVGVSALACVIQALFGLHPPTYFPSIFCVADIVSPFLCSPSPLSTPIAVAYPSAAQPYPHSAPMQPHAPPPPTWPPLPPHMPPMPHDAAAPASAPVPATPPSFPPPPAPATQPPHQPSPAPPPSAPPEPQPPASDAAPAAPAPPPAEKPPYPLFPPGLIPGMVRKKQVGSGVPYAPMAPHDIPSSIPPPHESEEYLRRRIARFFKAIGEKDPLAEGDEDEEEDAEEADGGRGILGAGIGKRGHGHGGHGRCRRAKRAAMAAAASNPSSTVTNISEFQCLAKEKLPKQAYDYYASGAEDQWTLAENRNAFERIRFRPRILIDVSSVDTTTSVLGHRISMPIMLAPTAFQRMAHPEGELATARAAAKFDTAMVLSSWATSSVEEVASVGPGLRFFQLYVYKDRQVVEQLVRRAERAGFKAIALTVDTPRLGRREADIKNRFVLPPHLTLKNFEGLNLGSMDKSQESGLSSYVAGQIDRSLSWKDIAWLKSITSLPILVKGVITAEDAEISIEYGAAGIIVSNHGARQLDYVSATICALEEVVKAARGRVPVFLDGGVRRGTDALKALALGAAGVFAGVERLLGILKDEFELAMALAGCTRVADIKRCHVETEEDRLRKAITSRL